MRIRTQFIMTMLLFGVLLVAISASAIITEQQVEISTEQERIASAIARGANELSYLANDYVIYRESQQLDRWQSRVALFSGDVAALRVDRPEQQALVSSIQASSRRMKEVFDSVVSAVGSLPAGQGRTVDQAPLQVSWSRMAVQSQSLATDAARLSQLLRAQADQLKQMHLMVIIAMIGVFGAYFVANYLLIQRRTLKSIAALQAGTRVVGSGNLDFEVKSIRNDEIGDLSHAFNQMTINLKEVTASKAELEREIYKRIEVEEELRVSNEHLQDQTLKLEEEIDERKKAEAALLQEKRIRDAIVENAGAMLVYLDRNFNFILANRAYIQGCGHTWEELMGKNHFDFFPNEENQAIFEKVRDTGEPVFFHDKPFVYSDQPERGVTYWDWTLVPVKDAEGKVGGLVCSLVETTERKKVEQLKDEFIGMVSHELKTPLTVIMGALSTAADARVSPEQARELLGDAVKHAGILANLVDNLLELSRQQSGRLTIQAQPTDIGEITRSVLKKLQGKSAIHSLSCDIHPALPPALADPLRVERILYNLVDNAIKYSPDGGEVRVFARQDGSYLIVGVKDRGPGISPDDQGRLFQSFERLGATVNGSIQGTGLGLRVCRILAEAHGGKIWVESDKGKGSTFLFTLPTSSER